MVKVVGRDGNARMFRVCHRPTNPPKLIGWPPPWPAGTESSVSSGQAEWPPSTWPPMRNTAGG